MTGAAPDGDERTVAATRGRRNRLLTSLSHPSWQGIGALIGVAGLVIAIITVLAQGGDDGQRHTGGPGSPGTPTVAGTSAVGGNGTSEAAPTPSAAEPTDQRSPIDVPLIDIPLVDDEFERSFGPGPLKVNADDYPDVYSAGLLCYPVGSAAVDEFQLDRKYGRLVTRVGLGDVGTDSGIRVKFTVFVDGTPARSTTVTVGEVKTIDVPVTGALRMSLEAEILDASTCYGRAVAAWVQPSFTP